MAAYRLSIRQSAVRELDRVSPKRDRIRVVTRIQELATDPRPNESRSSWAQRDFTECAGGSYRIVCAIDDHARPVDIMKIEHRRDMHRDV